MKKLKHILLVVIIGFLTSLSLDTVVRSSFWVAPNPQYSFAINEPAASDIFIFGMPDEDLVFTEVEGILSVGLVTGTIQKCNSIGASCTTLIANLVFDGGRDTFTEFTSSSIAANETLKWVTNSVNSPGFLLISLRYFPTG